MHAYIFTLNQTESNLCGQEESFHGSSCKTHITKYYSVTPSLRPVTCVLLVDTFHKSIQL